MTIRLASATQRGRASHSSWSPAGPTGPRIATVPQGDQGIKQEDQGDQRDGSRFPAQFGRNQARGSRGSRDRDKGRSKPRRGRNSIAQGAAQRSPGQSKIDTKEAPTGRDSIRRLRSIRISASNCLRPQTSCSPRPTGRKRPLPGEWARRLASTLSETASIVVIHTPIPPPTPRARTAFPCLRPCVIARRSAVSPA